MGLEEIHAISSEQGHLKTGHKKLSSEYYFGSKKKSVSVERSKNTRTEKYVSIHVEPKFTSAKTENKGGNWISFNIMLALKIKQAGSYLFSLKLETVPVNCNNTALQFKMI